MGFLFNQHSLGDVDQRFARRCSIKAKGKSLLSGGECIEIQLGDMVPEDDIRGQYGSVISKADYSSVCESFVYKNGFLATGRALTAMLVAGPVVDEISDVDEYFAFEGERIRYRIYYGVPFPCDNQIQLFGKQTVAMKYATLLIEGLFKCEATTHNSNLKENLSRIVGPSTVDRPGCRGQFITPHCGKVGFDAAVSCVVGGNLNGAANRMWQTVATKNGYQGFARGFEKIGIVPPSLDKPLVYAGKNTSSILQNPLSPISIAEREALEAGGRLTNTEVIVKTFLFQESFGQTIQKGLNTIGTYSIFSNGGKP